MGQWSVGRSVAVTETPHWIRPCVYMYLGLYIVTRYILPEYNMDNLIHLVYNRNIFHQASQIWLRNQVKVSAFILMSCNLYLLMVCVGGGREL